MAPSEEDDAAAAEWAAMLDAEEAQPVDDAAEAGGGGMMGADGKILSQDEIDSLLGFADNTSGSGKSTSGIYAILDKSLTAYEKLPMLEVVFDRLVRQLSTSLRNFTGENIDVSLDSMTSTRFDDYLNTIPLPAMLIVFRAIEWENFGIITVDSSLIYASVDVLLGGRKSPAALRVEGRPYTTIEQDIVKRLVDVVLGEMSNAFEPLSPATFEFDRLETNPRFATIARPANPALLVKLRIDMDERVGHLEILLPHATLEPIRDLLLQIFMGEKFGQDTVWEKHLGKELRATLLPIEAILDEKTVTLKDIMRLKVGSTMLFDVTPEDEIELRCQDVALTYATVGRVGDKIAVSLSESIKPKPKEQA